MSEGWCPWKPGEQEGWAVGAGEGELVRDLSRSRGVTPPQGLCQPGGLGSPRCPLVETPGGADRVMLSAEPNWVN